MFRTVALVVLVVAPIHAAAAAASCMTKSEAREAYSTSYLYWHGANHCWDATPNGRRDTATTATPRHHFVRPHRDEDQVARAQPQQPARTQPQPTMQEQPQPVIQTQPQLEGSAPLPLPELTSADLIRVGHTMRIEELESTLKDRWPDTNMEFQAKPALIVSAAADAEPLVPVRVVMLSIGVILVICTVLEVAFGTRIAPRRIDRYM